MKATAIVLLLLVAALIGLAAWRGDGALGAGFKTGGLQLLKFLPVMAVAILMMGFVDVLLPRRVVEDWLSDAAGFRGFAVAWLAGMLTPGGSIIGMPIAAGLFKAGVGPAVLVTYLTSMACLSVMRMPIEIGLLGWRLMALRVIACLVVPFVAGGIARLVAPLMARGA